MENKYLDQGPILPEGGKEVTANRPALSPEQKKDLDKLIAPVNTDTEKNLADLRAEKQGVGEFARNLESDEKNKQMVASLHAFEQKHATEWRSVLDGSAGNSNLTLG